MRYAVLAVGSALAFAAPAQAQQSDSGVGGILEDLSRSLGSDRDESATRDRRDYYTEEDERRLNEIDREIAQLERERDRLLDRRRDSSRR